jgi:hypothetical protein
VPFETFCVNFTLAFHCIGKSHSSRCDINILVSISSVFTSKTTTCRIEYTVVAGVQIGHFAIIYERLMINVKYLKHESKSTQYIILKKMSYLVEYQCVCCFITNDVQWVQYFGLGSSLCNL